MPGIFFFNGSSSVGKTTTLNQLNKNLFESIYISARDVRARLDNPSWDDLMVRSDLAMYHQQYILDSYINSIHLEIEKHIERESTKIMVFERSLWDVVGYSFAYNCNEDFINNQLKAIYNFENDLLKSNYAQIIRFPIDKHYPYEVIPERPPEIIRDLCDQWLEANWRKSLLTSHAMVRSDYFDVGHLQEAMTSLALASA